MRRSVLLVLVVIQACASAPAPVPAPSLSPARPDTENVQRRTEPGASRTDVVTPGEMNSDFSTFVAAVPPDEPGGECMTLPSGPGRRFVLLSFPTRDLAIRRVGFSVDSAGHVLDYSDLRGDLREENEHARTSITINFEAGFATATNATAGVHTGTLSGPAELALSAPTLGVPKRMIELVRTRCDTGAR